jgi:hypothetical protein
VTNPFRRGLWIRHRIGAIGATASGNMPMMPDGYAAYQQAQQDLDNAIAYATAMRDQAYAEAAARRDARLADPYQDEQYANQEAEAYAAYYSALDQAGDGVGSCRAGGV